MKTYVLTLSHSFPANHAMHGKPTYFREKFLGTPGMLRKLHTIRANYTLWAKRIAEVQRGEAVLSVRQWSGRPYASKQETIATLTAADNVGIQKLRIKHFQQHLNSVVYLQPFIYDETTMPVNEVTLANNDGLSLKDWKEWFKNYDLSKPLAIIHFTPFRYL